MNAYRIPLSALVLLGLTACASTPRPTTAQLGQALKSGKVVVAPIPKPIRLSEKTKAQAVGAAVVASVVGSALGGGNVEASRVFAETTGKALPDSYRVESGAGADLALARKFSDYFNGQAAGAAAGRYLLTVNASLWELGYVSFLTSQDYALRYHFYVEVKEDRDGKLKWVKGVHCDNLGQPEQTGRMPLEAWQADGYKALDAVAERVVEQCYQQGLRELGLV